MNINNVNLQLTIGTQHAKISIPEDKIPLIKEAESRLQIQYTQIRQLYKDQDENIVFMLLSLISMVNQLENEAKPHVIASPAIDRPPNGSIEEEKVKQLQETLTVIKRKLAQLENSLLTDTTGSLFD